MSKTGYYTHKDCWKHQMGAYHPECPARLDAIEDRLLVTGVADVVDRREAPLAAISDLELAHDRFYIASLRGMTDQLVDDQKAGGPELVHIDGDTAMNTHTWQGPSCKAIANPSCGTWYSDSQDIPRKERHARHRRRRRRR